MIILHKGTGDDGRIHFGYVIKQKLKCYIINNKGQKIKVQENTVSPVFDHDWIEKHKTSFSKLPECIEPEKLHRISDYFSANAAIPELFKNQGAEYLEDLSTWTDKEILRVRTIGKNRLEQIKEIMRENGIEPLE